MHFVNELIGFEKRDTSGAAPERLLAKWFVLCDECETKHGDDIFAAIEQTDGGLQVGGDMVWPDADIDSLRSRGETDLFLDEHCPPGWGREFVLPPWKREGVEAVSGCRSCGATNTDDGRPWASATLLRADPEREVLRFSFAMVCEACATDPVKMDDLATRVFEPQ